MRKYLERHDISEEDRQRKDVVIAIYEELKKKKKHVDAVDLLCREFAKVKKKNLMFMELDELIQMRLVRMLKDNPKRVNYYERYRKIIDEYDQEQDRADIEKLFMELIDLANSMSQEEQRYVHEGFTSDEELSLYDMLFGKILWEGLPECYSDSAIFTYRQKIYEYVYMRYKEVA